MIAINTVSRYCTVLQMFNPYSSSGSTCTVYLLREGTVLHLSVVLGI